MRRRYQETREKFKEYSRQFSKGSSNSNQQKPRDNINIHIFNITSRNRNMITSTGRKPNFEQLDESMQLEDKLRRGGSVFHRKSEKNELNASVNNGPVIPTYDLKCKPSGSRLNIYTKEKEEIASSEATPSVNIKDTTEEQVGVEELHFQKVRLQLKWKRLLNQ